MPKLSGSNLLRRNFQLMTSAASLKKTVLPGVKVTARFATSKLCHRANSDLPSGGLKHFHSTRTGQFSSRDGGNTFHRDFDGLLFGTTRMGKF
jgi:hypothetical protein